MDFSEAQLLSSLNTESRALHALEPVPNDPTIEVETVSPDGLFTIAKDSVPPSGVTWSNLFRHPDTHPVVLDLILLKRYGPEGLLIDPSGLWARIQEDFKTQVSELTLSKLMAMRTLHLVDSYWQRWEVFNWCTAALNALFPDFEVLQVPTVTQCAISVDIANRVRTDVDWTAEVQGFVHAVFLHDQIVVPQAPLGFVQVKTGEFDIDVEALKARWATVRLQDHAPEGDDLVTIQLQRMWVVQHNLELSRARLRAQLPLVSHA